MDNIDFYPYGLNRLLRDPQTLLKILGREKRLAQQIATAGNQSQKEAFARQQAQELIKREKNMKGRFDGWQVFQDGIAHRFDSIEFRRAGSIHYNLFGQRFGQEKAVDVKLATDLLERRNIYDIGIVVSGDQDYVPAVQAAKDSGKQIVNVSFLKRDGRLLPGGARRLNQATDRTIEMSYAELKGFMRFPAPLAVPQHATHP